MSITTGRRIYGPFRGEVPCQGCYGFSNRRRTALADWFAWSQRSWLKRFQQSKQWDDDWNISDIQQKAMQAWVVVSGFPAFAQCNSCAAKDQENSENQRDDWDEEHCFCKNAYYCTLYNTGNYTIIVVTMSNPFTTNKYMIIYIYDAICCKMIQNAKYDTWARNMLFEDSRKRKCGALRTCGPCKPFQIKREGLLSLTWQARFGCKLRPKPVWPHKNLTIQTSH